VANRPTAWELGSQPLPQDSDWLLPFLPTLQKTRSDAGHVLEIGCGPGLDAATLLGHGFEVRAFDRAPLTRARATAPGAQLLRADLLHIPFRDGAFDSAVSSLALHYLPWVETRAAFAEVRRVLAPEAPFLFRVNATDDYNHGAGEGERLEPNFYRTPNAFHAETKRFFDEAMVRAAVMGFFEIEHLAHRTIHRYEQPKQAWECLARAQ
jgi:SAM-dependent methyltransferase